MNKILKKYVCWISLLLIIIIGLSILKPDFEYFENSSLEDRVKSLENKINNMSMNLEKTSNTVTLDNRLGVLENYGELATKSIDKFISSNKDRYEKMYLWYARLTGADPEEVNRDNENKVEKNEQKFKDIEDELKMKYNKK